MHETLDFRSREMLNFGFLEKYLRIGQLLGLSFKWKNEQA